MGAENTPLVCGGMYRTKQKPGRPIYTAMIVSVVQPLGNDKTLGLLQVIGYATERVHEGSDRLNEFELIYAPTLLKPKKVTRRKAAPQK